MVRRGNRWNAPHRHEGTEGRREILGHGMRRLLALFEELGDRERPGIGVGQRVGSGAGAVLPVEGREPLVNVRGERLRELLRELLGEPFGEVG